MITILIIILLIELAILFRLVKHKRTLAQDVQFWKSSYFAEKLKRSE